MHIGIDYTAAAWQGAGIGRYTRDLVRAIVEAGPQHRYTMFFASGGIDKRSPYLDDLRALCHAHTNIRVVPIGLSPRRLTQFWQRLRAPLPVEVFTGKLDLVHAPDFVLPPTRARTLLTIHDLSFLVYPEFAARGMARYLSDAVPRSLKRANLVLADSKATASDLERLLNIDPAHVEVVYPGVAGHFRPMPAEACAEAKQRHNLPDNFLLFVSTLSPRKNLVRLIEAFGQVARDPAYPDLHLALAGQPGWLYEDVYAAIERQALSERIRLLDFVDDKDLPALYNLARICVYPSLYEGFGLPVLEALACGTPVVTGNNSSLPEVTGDAAVLVESTSIDAIAAGIRQVLGDHSVRERLRTAGPPQAATFTWQQAAQQVLRGYERAAHTTTGSAASR